MSDCSVKKIVVVGGGTAGWLTAARLAKAFNIKANPQFSVQLIESPDIPTIGVGEGTWPTMRKTLKSLGISETDFMRACDATFKQGTQFINWRSDESEHPGESYYHMFSSLIDPADFNLTPYWRSGLNGDTSFARSVSPQTYVCEKRLAPKRIKDPEYDGVVSYAYHLDAGKFAQYLTRYACDSLGVEHLLANVSSVQCDDSGNIVSLTTSENKMIDGEFFIDCTGFQALLIDKTLKVPVKSISDQIFVNKALAIQQPWKDEACELASVTRSTATEAGWIWDIGLTGRRGTGHVYSDQFISDDEAEKRLRVYLGDDKAELPARLISMDLGYRKKFWSKNCVAIGMSAGFVEPLEASAIFLIEASCNLLLDLLPAFWQDPKGIRAIYNRSMLMRWQHTIEFIKLHYCLSKRQGDFWLANKNADTIPERLIERLQRWQRISPTKYEFRESFEPFVQESYQYILCGMEELEEAHYPALDCFDGDQAEAFFRKVDQLGKELTNILPGNRALINQIHEFGMSGV